MAFEEKDGQGALFQNERKNKDTSPDYTGSVTIEGTKYRLAGWKQQSRNGKPYLSLKAQPEQEKTPDPNAPLDNDSEMPF